MIEKLAPIILDEIKKANNVLLHCHPSPDADSIGGSLAMMQVLEGMGKNVTLIKGDSEIPSSFRNIPGIEKIVAKNYFEIDLSKYDLFIIHDSGGLNQISRVSNVVFPEHLQTIAIDHHSTNPHYAKINLVEPTYPATCQVLFDLFMAWKVEITPNIAKCLLLGIYMDTGGFKFPLTNSRTFEASAYLAKIAPDYTRLIASVENSNLPGTVIFQGLALSNVKHFCNNKLAISVVSYEDLRKNNISHEDLYPDIASILKSVIGWEIGVKMVEDQPGGVRISFRTRDENIFDVSKIATALGGGGHRAAAATYLEVSLEEALKSVVEQASKLYTGFAR